MKRWIRASIADAEPPLTEQGRHPAMTALFIAPTQARPETVGKRRRADYNGALLMY